MENLNSLEIQIHDLKEVSYLTQITSDITSDFSDENVDMRLSFLLNGSPNDSLLEIRIRLEYRYRFSNNRPKTFFSLEISTFFLFENLPHNQELIILGEKRTHVDDSVIIRLLNISIGNTRGYAASKFATLPINLVMPLVNPQSLLDRAKKLFDSEIPKLKPTKRKKK